MRQGLALWPGGIVLDFDVSRLRAMADAETGKEGIGGESAANESTRRGSSSQASTALDQRLGGLMRRAQAGDKRAYACLLQEVEPVIRRVSRKAGVVGDRIEDVMQETLLTLHHARQTYDPSRSFVAWLTVIAKRRAIDTLRRTGRSDRRELSAPTLYEQHTDLDADTSRGWEEGARAQELRAAIATLSPSQREAVEHLALREQSLAEAAAETGKTTGALKVNFHRALKALRNVMGRGDDG